MRRRPKKTPQNPPRTSETFQDSGPDPAGLTAPHLLPPSLESELAGRECALVAGPRGPRDLRSKHVPPALSANCSTFPPPPPLLGGLRHWSPLSSRRGGLCCPSLGGRAGRRGARGSRAGLPAALPDPAAPCTDPAGGRTHFLRQRFQRRGAETAQAERSCRRCVRVTWGYPGGSSDGLRLWGDRRSLHTRLGTLSQTLLASRF